ncbi:hypothetical protein Pcinc_007088 [Petrolisthes cinctipes]|uniref:Uncharacterized protein n=1 Tax=Petrolisthes cinctipes TaxID=88211 RepID=A0AAE1GBU2_PETCI|nr:hypothetical protein Pcinc_007088 [Petrolisthes cinctipes]
MDEGRGMEVEGGKGRRKKQETPTGGREEIKKYRNKPTNKTETQGNLTKVLSLIIILAGPSLGLPLDHSDSQHSVGQRSPPTQGVNPSSDRRPNRQTTATLLTSDEEDLHVSSSQTQPFSLASHPPRGFLRSGIGRSILGGNLGGFGGLAGFGSSASFFPTIGIPVGGQTSFLPFSPGSLSLGNLSPVTSVSGTGYGRGLQLGYYGSQGAYIPHSFPLLPQTFNKKPDTFLHGVKINTRDFSIPGLQTSNPYQSDFKVASQNPSTYVSLQSSKDRFRELEAEVVKELDMNEADLTLEQRETKRIYESLSGILRDGENSGDLAEPHTSMGYTDASRTVEPKIALHENSKHRIVVQGGHPVVATSTVLREKIPDITQAVSWSPKSQPVSHSSFSLSFPTQSSSSLPSSSQSPELLSSFKTTFETITPRPADQNTKTRLHPYLLNGENIQSSHNVFSPEIPHPISINSQQVLRQEAPYSGGHLLVTDSPPEFAISSGSLSEPKIRGPHIASYQNKNIPLSTSLDFQESKDGPDSVSRPQAQSQDVHKGFLLKSPTAEEETKLIKDHFLSGSHQQVKPDTSDNDEDNLRTSHNFRGHFQIVSDKRPKSDSSDNDNTPERPFSHIHVQSMSDHQKMLHTGEEQEDELEAPFSLHFKLNVNLHSKLDRTLTKMLVDSNQTLHSGQSLPPHEPPRHRQQQTPYWVQDIPNPDNPTGKIFSSDRKTTLPLLRPLPLPPPPPPTLHSNNETLPTLDMRDIDGSGRGQEESRDGIDTSQFLSSSEQPESNSDLILNISSFNSHILKQSPLTPPPSILSHSPTLSIQPNSSSSHTQAPTLSSPLFTPLLTTLAPSPSDLSLKPSPHLTMPSTPSLSLITTSLPPSFTPSPSLLTNDTALSHIQSRKPPHPSRIRLKIRKILGQHKGVTSLPKSDDESEDGESWMRWEEGERSMIGLGVEDQFGEKGGENISDKDENRENHGRETSKTERNKGSEKDEREECETKIKEEIKEERNEDHETGVSKQIREQKELGSETGQIIGETEEREISRPGASAEMGEREESESGWTNEEREREQTSSETEATEGDEEKDEREGSEIGGKQVSELEWNGREKFETGETKQSEETQGREKLMTDGKSEVRNQWDDALILERVGEIKGNKELMNNNNREKRLRPIPQSTSAVPQFTPKLTPSTSVLLQFTQKLPQSTPMLPQSTPMLPQSTPTMPQSTPTVPQFTSILPQSTPPVPSSTPKQLSFTSKQPSLNSKPLPPTQTQATPISTTPLPSTTTTESSAQKSPPKERKLVIHSAGFILG